MVQVGSKFGDFTEEGKRAYCSERIHDGDPGSSFRFEMRRMEKLCWQRVRKNITQAEKNVVYTFSRTSGWLFRIWKDRPPDWGPSPRFIVTPDEDRES